MENTNKYLERLEQLVTYLNGGERPRFLSNRMATLTTQSFVRDNRNEVFALYGDTTLTHIDTHLALYGR